MTRFLALPLLLALSTPAAAVLKCIGPGGKIEYMEGTCPDGYKAYEVKVDRPPSEVDRLRQENAVLRQQQYVSPGRDPNVEYGVDAYRNTNREYIEYKANRDKQRRCDKLLELAGSDASSNARADANYERMRLNCR